MLRRGGPVGVGLDLEQRGRELRLDEQVNETRCITPSSLRGSSVVHGHGRVELEVRKMIESELF